MAMAALSAIDGQFHRAVDIVQSLPKGGPVQTSYEEKLWLYSLYKQATEGNIAVPRPGLLDMLGRAKWDSWNKQKGIDKSEAKRLYVAALIKILKKHAGQGDAAAHIAELESYSGAFGDEPRSPTSSDSSFHSSRASPINAPSPLPPQASSMSGSGYSLFPPPDPHLPIPDIAPEIIPPSALNASHKSLLQLNQNQIQNQNQDHPDQPLFASTSSMPYPSNINALPGVGSKAHSLVGGRGGSEASFLPNRNRKDSAHSFRQTQQPQIRQAQPASALGFLPEVATQRLGAAQTQAQIRRSPEIPIIRDFATVTPDFTPYLGTNITPNPNLMYPPRPGPGSTSTFSHANAPLSLPNTLQQIQTSLAALHERLATLERTQSMILRRDERKKGWFWTSREEEELDLVEEEAEQARYGLEGTATTAQARVKRKKGLTLRVAWLLLTLVRRAMIDVSVGMLLLAVGFAIFGGGWVRARLVWRTIRARIINLLWGLQ